MRLTVLAALLSAAALTACAGTQSASNTTLPAPPAAHAVAAPVTPVQTEQVAEADSADPIICQKEPDSTSRVRRNKVCLHKSQWEAMSDKDQKTFHDARGVTMGPQGGGT